MPRAFVLLPGPWGRWFAAPTPRGAVEFDSQARRSQGLGRPSDADSGQAASGMSMGMAKPWRKRVRGPGQNHVHPSAGAGALHEGRFRPWRAGCRPFRRDRPRRAGPRTRSLCNQLNGLVRFHPRDGRTRTPYIQIISLVLYPNELHPWSTQRDSNPRLPDRSGALPGWAMRTIPPLPMTAVHGTAGPPAPGESSRTRPAAVTGQSPGAGV